MSIKIMSAVFDLKGLTPTEKLILLALADHADDSGRCYPSIERMSNRTCLSERALQVNIRKLTSMGFIAIEKGGGRGRANEYIVTANPAPETPFEKPCFKNTVSEDINPAPRALNPAPRAPQPSLTIIEPSKEDIIGENRKPSSSDVVAILCEVVDREYAESFITHRKRLKKPFSEIAARRVVKTLWEISGLGFDPNDALALTEERGWATIKTDWFMKEQNNGQRNYNSQQSPQGQRGADPALENIARILGLGSEGR